ncbi:alpha/beta hydrolase [Amycolatopsis acidicola]|uniref:Alpha/beta hydrolase n=1 Tax=Amycolatopsis acidicola TaxID=2596893 RepID=A0A5N0UT17_9PSEU|nr:alpha/beta hydrolase [Amycolatopsis acidicola]KAA9154318.1 alpha/beta hydrolase [Amycolatopsis acidicola]
MTVALVHGNPETDAIWGPLLDELGRDDVVCLSPPGFGAPVPPGFGATAEEYRDWLVRELEGFGEPVHLVGHDWGGGHVLAVAATRPDLLRSWASDVLGLADPEYVWHDLAQIWRTPGKGEELISAMLGAPLAERTKRMAGLGLPADVAEAVAAGQGEEMGRCVLALYRSAGPEYLAALGEKLPIAAARPGLNILATEDTYVGTDAQRRRAAGRASARTEVLDGLGHWWMLQDPARGADLLRRFLAEVA